MNKFLKETVENVMDVYKKAFEEGRKVGYQEGVIATWKEVKKNLDKKDKEENEELENMEKYFNGNPVLPKTH